MMDVGSLLSLDGDSVIFSCGLLLPFKQEAAAVALCKRIEENNPHTLKFTLNTETHPPYVRLYETILPKKNIEKAVARLKQISEPMIPFHMNWGMVERTDHFLAIWGELNDALKIFHQAVLIDINDLREGDFKEKYSKNETNNLFSEAEEKSFRKWGSPWAEPYLPHMIITKADPVFEVQKIPLEWEFKQCVFRGVIAATCSSKGDFTNHFQIDFNSLL